MPDTVQNDFKVVTRALKDSLVLSDFIRTPVIPFEKRKTILEEIFKNKIHAETIKFLIFLASQRRLNFLKEICEAFDDLYLEYKNTVRAFITSNTELNTHQISDISHHMKLKLRKEVQPVLKVDKNLIGGIKIRIDDFIYDYSIKTQLDKFKYNIIHS